MRGQVLLKLAAEAQDHVNTNEDGRENELSMHNNEIEYVPTNRYSWYYELKYYLQHGLSPTYLDPRKRI